MNCKTCKDKGWLMWVSFERTPMPAYWFSRGPQGERPITCGCDVLGHDEPDTDQSQTGASA